MQVVRIGLLAVSLSSAAQLSGHQDEFQLRTSTSYPDGLERWTPAFSVERRYLVYSQVSPDSLSIGTPRASVISYSPDARHFFFVERRGMLARDSQEFILSIFASKDVAKELEKGSKLISPSHKIVMARSVPPGMQRSEATTPGISYAHWRDNEHLVFVGRSETEPCRGLYCFNVENGELQRLTSKEHEMLSFWYQGKGVLYTAKTTSERQRATAPVVAIRDGITLSEEAFDLYRLKTVSTYFSRFEEGAIHKLGSYVVDDRNPTPPLVPTLSRNGRWAIGTLPVTVERPGVALRNVSAPGAANAEATWPLTLIDLKNGNEKEIAGLAIGSATSVRNSFALPRVLWTADNKHAIIANIAGKATSGYDDQIANACLIDFAVEENSWRVIRDMVDPVNHSRVIDVRVGVDDHIVIAVADTEGKRQNFFYQTSSGKISPDATTAPLGAPAPVVKQAFAVLVREDANTPPVVVATDGAQEATLSDTDPLFAKVWRAPAQTVEFKRSSGKADVGILMLPRDGKAPFPLVIQLGHYSPERFLPDGTSPSGYAAQSLAASGFAVLQLGIGITRLSKEEVREKLEKSRTWEGPDGVEQVDLAVRCLEEEGLIDSKRVGLIGFSRAGYITHYVSTHPGNTHLRAAIVIDGNTGSYGEYFQAQATTLAPGIKSFVVDEFDLLYDGNIWDNKARARWLADAPAFNVNRVEAPMLIYTCGAPVLQANGSEMRAAYDLNHRELDMALFPYASHELSSPAQRVAAMELTVDWMKFWLQDREDPGRSNTSQYVYWRTLKKQRDERWMRKGSPYDNATRTQH